MPVGHLVENELQSLLTLEAQLAQRVVAQDNALAALAESLRTAKAGLKSEHAPLGVFLLAGPSGVGKTETALALADLLFGGEAALTTINMSEYQESVELATLQWVAWFNHHRLMEPLGYIPPAEAEANYYRQLETAAAEPPST